MGKRGPCFHCGIDRTPLWRNGPPEKPVLCNACGSRYRLRGTLANYTPKHLQALLPSQNHKKYRRHRTIGLNPIPPKFQQADQKPDDNFKDSSCAVAAGTGSYHEADISNNSISTESSTSLSSYPDNKKSHGSQSPGKIQRSSLDFHVPSRKRSLVTYHTLAPIEQFQRDLYKILIYDEPSLLHESQEDVLLYNTNNQIAPTEIGLGSILLKK